MRVLKRLCYLRFPERKSLFNGQLGSTVQLFYKPFLRFSFKCSPIERCTELWPIVKSVVVHGLPPSEVHDFLFRESVFSSKRRNDALPSAFVAVNRIHLNLLFEQPVVGHADEEIKLLEVVPNNRPKICKEGAHTYCGNKSIVKDTKTPRHNFCLLSSARLYSEATVGAINKSHFFLNLVLESVAGRIAAAY